MSPAALEALVGNQSIWRAMIAMPMTEATSPMAIIRPIGCFSPSIRGSSSGSAAGATGPSSLSRSRVGHRRASLLDSAVRRRAGREWSRKAEGARPWWRRNALANCAGWR